ncbi:hypothetical protein L2E82_39019 [Cichorium intybus]|uniref:Uncharacterized protein n=1 Tax=Cichorium intybus TaxID=13427 RepID=A0ACB9AGA5_CICIN|nr:hypothetical protein L2E82_39019 [Cichorium intybus]
MTIPIGITAKLKPFGGKRTIPVGINSLSHTHSNRPDGGGNYAFTNNNVVVPALCIGSGDREFIERRRSTKAFVLDLILILQ